MKIERLQISSLTMDPENAKLHPDFQVEQIKKSVQCFGMNDPVGIWGEQNLIANSTKRDEIVLDPFGGSGTTLMACEQLGRVCRTAELDEKYATAIVDRWEEYTHQKARRI